MPTATGQLSTTSSVGSPVSNPKRSPAASEPRDLDLGLATSPAIGRGVAGPSADAVPKRRIRWLLIPLGATEQHGPHLPLATDTIIATAWALAAANQVGEAVVAPALPYGSSGEHQGFAGTMSIGREAFSLVLTELVRSVSEICQQVVLVSGHGGNAPVLAPTVEQLNSEGHSVSWVAPHWPAEFATDAHGGLTETSLLLHLQPDLVGPYADAAGNITPLTELMPALVEGGLAAVTANGVLGDPSGATAEHGAKLFAHLVESLAEHLTSS